MSILSVKSLAEKNPLNSNESTYSRVMRGIP